MPLWSSKTIGRYQNGSLAFSVGVNFLSGEKKENEVTTKLGVFQTDSCPQDNGSVLLTIRPENVGILDEPTPNSFPAHVLSRMYVGTHTYKETKTV